MYLERNHRVWKEGTASMKGVSEKDREEPITEWREDEKGRSMLRRDALSHNEEELPARLWEGLWKELLPL